MPRRAGGSTVVAIGLVLLLAFAPQRAANAAGTSSRSSKSQSITALPGCSSGTDTNTLTPELTHCSWTVQMQRQSVRWYSFELGSEAAAKMSVVIMARAVSGQITM